MQGKKYTTANRLNRRRFINNTIKLTVLGTLLAPLEQACNNKKSSKPRDPGKDNKQPSSKSKRKRTKWSHETLVMNSKTKVMHFPTSRMYKYYDEIKSNHLQEISLATWMNQLQDPVRMNKNQSGNITEMLTLKELSKEVNDISLVTAIDTLSVAFGKEYEKANATNFRLHELMLQLVALNGMIPADQKWTTFSAKVVKPAQLRKRQKWMETETSFNERVKYILDRSNDYKTRLSKRAVKYSFS